MGKRVYHTVDIYWYPHVLCYTREKLVAVFCFYFWKVIIFNPQSFSLCIQLPYYLPSFPFRCSRNTLPAAGNCRAASHAVPHAQLGAHLPPPCSAGCSLALQSKTRMFCSSSLCISFYLMFSQTNTVIPFPFGMGL